MTSKQKNNRKSTRARRPRVAGGARNGGKSNADRSLAITVDNKSTLSMIVEPWMPLFPPRVTKWLRYASGHQGLSSSSGVVSTQVFSANGAFDPDVTGTGHQPMGFDQMMAFYNHYCVTHARLHVRFASASGSYGTACIRVDAGSTPITDIERIMEFGGNVTVGLESIGNFGANKELNMSISIAKLQGVSEMALTADPTLRGDVTANPTEQTYFHVQLWNAAGVTCTANIYSVLEQRVVFMEPRTAALSLGRDAVENKSRFDDDGPVVIEIPAKGLANAMRIHASNRSCPVALLLDDLKIKEGKG